MDSKPEGELAGKSDLKKNAFNKKASVKTLQKHDTIKQERPTVLSQAATNENFLKARRHQASTTLL